MATIRRLPRSLRNLAMTLRAHSYLSSREGRRPTTRSRAVRSPRGRRLPHSLHSLAMTERANSYMSSREGRRPTTRSRAYPYGNNSEIATVASQHRNDTEGLILPVFASPIGRGDLGPSFTQELGDCRGRFATSQ